MAEGEEPTKVSTESSKKVLKTVAGRLSKMEAGDLPTIERVAADGSTRAVDHTGEMIRPSAAQVEAAREANRPSSDDLEAAREAAEQFSAEHRAHPTPPAPKQQPQRPGDEQLLVMIAPALVEEVLVPVRDVVP